MKIDITDVCADDSSPIKRALKKAIDPAPAVVIQGTRAVKAHGLSIPVRISNGPKDLDERRRITTAVDDVLVHHGYIISTITHV